MEPDIDPEPTSQERAALERALQRLLAGPTHARSDWWRCGVGESVGEDPFGPAPGAARYSSSS